MNIETLHSKDFTRLHKQDIFLSIPSPVAGIHHFVAVCLHVHDERNDQACEEWGVSFEITGVLQQYTYRIGRALLRK
jgi:hypothetical protein